ncbi:MAG: DNA methylase [Rhodocyclaceae bacterium]|nr:DNA methylase [Rhodocyclaceae bacterium]
MADLFSKHPKASGSVQCLGKHFPNEQARRDHFIKRLAEKLKDPDFQKIQGFPSGSDADILALSDPPFYTACPNPFIDEFIQHYGKPYDSSVRYSKEPFAADVSEGKNDPIYTAHSYHTKVPHKAIMRYILHYTKPGDIVLDGFCGTGMTGIAAQLCGDIEAVRSLGYKVDKNGAIHSVDRVDGKDVWTPFSKLGARYAVLNDLSPAASFIAFNYNTPLDSAAFENIANRILDEIETEYGWMFQTTHTDGRATGKINYTIWSDIFTCPECAGEIVFWDAAVDRDKKEVIDDFDCPHCSASLSKRKVNKALITIVDPSTGTQIKQAKQKPVLINYTAIGKKWEKAPTADDLALIERIDSLEIRGRYPTDRMIAGTETRRNDPIGVTHVHHFYTRRNLAVISAFLEKVATVDDFAIRSRLVFAKTASERITSKLSSIAFSYFFHGGGGFINAGRKGTLYISSVGPEVPAYLSLRSRISSVNFSPVRERASLVECKSTTDLRIPSDSIDYLFIDPPFGANINYSELNFIWEAWLGVQTQIASEAIENKGQGKSLNDYRKLMSSCFREAYRVLKPGRWMTVEFSNTQASVWNAIQTALQEAGFVVANVAALDKKQNSIQAYTTPTAVKQDLVISAYKPNGGLEDRFEKSGGSEDSLWDFVRTHLNYLPTVKSKNGDLEFIAERDPRIIFDRMVAWFVRHNTPIPLSSQEFQEGLRQRFPTRDGMIFLPDQVTEYDKKRAQSASAPQMELFVSDERSAIDWLTDFLKQRPSTYQELHPEFISQLGAGWKRHESKPELSALLEDSFIQYDGTGDVPSQIHSYLSSNHRDLRGLEKDSPQLVSKAKDRWFVPDPNKAQDLEKKREKALLKEFAGYQAATGRKLKEFRLEVLRAGFKAAWGAKNYKAIIAIAQKIPEEALQEDEKLLLWYDQALTRTEAGA